MRRGVCWIAAKSGDTDAFRIPPQGGFPPFFICSYQWRYIRKEAKKLILDNFASSLQIICMWIKRKYVTTLATLAPPIKRGYVPWKFSTVREVCFPD